MELAWLEDFVALAESRTFTRAAERRHVTQPAFSRRIRQLERWVGVALFHRVPGGVTLTTAGEQFERGAADLARRLTALAREAREAAGRETATLRIAATHALSATFFPVWIRKVEAAGAIAPVRLISDSMTACEEMMLHGEAQFLLCHQHVAAPGPLDGRAFRRIDIGEDLLAPFAAPAANGGERWPLTDDGAIPLLAYDDASGLGRIWAAQHFAEKLPGIERIFAARLAATLMTMACEGRGVAWLPRTLAERDVTSGQLQPCAGADIAVPLTICLYRPVARQAPTAEAFSRLAESVGSRTAQVPG